MNCRREERRKELVVVVQVTQPNWLDLDPNRECEKSKISRNKKHDSDCI